MIFLYVTRRFLASLFDDAKYHEKCVRIGYGGEFFKVKGNTLLERNYLEMFPYDKFSNVELPNLHVGQLLSLEGFLIKIGQTSAPRLLSETDLISTMDKNGIGTDATIHEHIKKVVDRGYAVVSRGRFKPTGLGVGLVLSYDRLRLDVSLTQPLFRAKMEKSMDEICRGAQDQPILTEFISSYAKVFQNLVSRVDDFVATVGFYITHTPENLGLPNNNAAEFPNPRSRGRREKQRVEQEYKCDCGLYAKKYTSRTEQTEGKLFIRCPKTVYGCKFFKWL